MTIDGSVGAFSPMNFEQLAEMQQLNQEVIKEMAQEATLRDALQIADGEALVFNPDPANPKLQPPDSALASQSWSVDKQIALLLTLQSDELTSLLKTLNGYEALTDAGVKPEQLAKGFKELLANNPHSPYSAEHLAKRALGEQIEKMLQDSPSPELEKAWFGLRAEILKDTAPQSAVLVDLIRQALIQQGYTPEQAVAEAEKQAVTLVDEALSDNGVVTPFYGMHPEMGDSVNAALASIIGTTESIKNPEEAAVFLEDLAQAEKLVLGALQNAVAVDKSGKVGETAGATLLTPDKVINGTKQMVEELSTLLAGLPDFAGKAGLLETLLIISSALLELERMFAEVERADFTIARSQSLAKADLAIERAKTILKQIKEAIKKYEEALEKMEKMKSSMGFISKLSDIINGIMMAIMGSLLLAISALVLSLMVGLGLMAIVMAVAPIVLIAVGAGGTLLIAILAVVLAVFLLPLAATGAGALAAVVLGILMAAVLLTIEVAMMAILFLIEVSMMVGFIIMLVIWVVAFLIWLAAFLLFAMIVVSYAVTEHTSVTDDMVTAMGPALQALLSELGIDIDDMDTVFTILSIAPLVMVAVLVALPFLILLLAIILIAVAVVAVLAVAAVAVVAVVAVAAMSIIMAGLISLLVPLITIIAQFISMGAAITAIIYAVVVTAILIVLLIALTILLTLLGTVASLIIMALLPALCYLMMQWLPMFFAKSGMLGKMASGLGGAFGMSEEEIEELEQLIYDFNAAATAMAGGKVHDSHYSIGANAERDAREYDVISDREQEEKLEKQIEKLMDFFALFGHNVESALDRGKAERREKEREESLKAMRQVMVALKKILALLAQGAEGAKLAAEMPTPEAGLQKAGEAIGELFVGSIGALPEMMAQMSPGGVGMNPESLPQIDPEKMALGASAFGSEFINVLKNALPTEAFFAAANERDKERYSGEDHEEELHRQFSATSQILG